MSMNFHGRYLTLVDEIERRFRVAEWRSGDVPIWPLARMELYLDMYWSSVGTPRPQHRPFPWRAAARCARPIRNVWRSRHDLRHFIARPKPADVIFLGDGVSLDFVDGHWQDRYCDPVIDALQRQGRSTFLMQCGDLRRLPWRRPTYAANIIAVRGARPGSGGHPAALSDHEEVLDLLARNDVIAPALRRDRLETTARNVSLTADAFESVLSRVAPKLAFVVTYYADLGPAFLLACRRQGILSIDLQHCPQEGAHKAYGWSAVPDEGYATLPAVFWNWTDEDAATIRRWTQKLTVPWHRSLRGGHTQLDAFIHADDAQSAAWDAKYRAAAGRTAFERNILVALQPIGGHRADWRALARQIASSPRAWRWWIRRHPAANDSQGVEYANLLSMAGANVLIDEASQLPLPVLLPHMSALVSIASGAAAEAAAFGVPAFFLSDAACGPFAALIESGTAKVVSPEQLIAELRAVSPYPVSRTYTAADLNGTLHTLQSMAGDYWRMCHAAQDAMPAGGPRRYARVPTGRCQQDSVIDRP